jgi:hypothetical protein
MIIRLAEENLKARLSRAFSFPTPVKPKLLRHQNARHRFVIEIVEIRTDCNWLI